MPSARFLEIDQRVQPRPKGERKPKAKMCYLTAREIQNRDAFNIKVVQGVKVVDGFAFQHAWNKIGDEYFDWYLSPGEVRQTSYCSQLELDDQQYSRFMVATRLHGDFTWIAQAERDGHASISDEFKIVWHINAGTDFAVLN